MRSSRSRTRGNKGVEPASDAVEVASTNVRGNKRPRQQQQSKQPQQQQQQQQQKKGGAKGKVDRHAALDEHMRREASDPYHICCPDLYPRCTRQDHARKKNCSNNPRCLYGLGEGKEGIWSARPSLLSALGDDLSGVLKETALTPHADTANKTPGATAAAAATPAATGSGTTSTPTPGGDVVASPPPPRLPTGLKNLGATCYLNSQLQALFANKSFRDGVFSWKPSSTRAAAAAAAGVGGASAVAVVDPTRSADGGGGGGGSGGSGASGVGSDGSDGRDVSHGGASEGVVVGEAVIQAVSSENEDDKIMRELQVVFGHMQEGIAKVYDPSAFPALLRMDTGSQQDPQEFSNFFRMLLERCFQRSPPPLRTLVQDTFCGEVAYITRCLTCKGGPRQQRTFNDLVLQINRHRSVEAILDGHLEREILDGSNQYNCESCGRKQDAMTMTELVRLPPVLSLQLVRYEYDYKTMEKKKIKAAVSLPPTLDMGPRIGPQGEGESGASVGGASVSPASGEKGRGEEFVYDLRCVLYHKGSNVHSGHIVAEVHDSATDTWTLFDDEKVRHIPGVNMSHPSHAAGGNGNGNNKKGKGKKQAKGKGNGNGKGKGKSKGEKEAEAKPSTSDDAASPVAAAVEADADEETSREASETGHDVGGSGSRKKVENGSSDNKRHLNDDDNGGESRAAKDSSSMAKKKNKTSRAVVVDAAETTGSATAAGSKGKRKGQEGTPAAVGRRERGKRSKVVEKDGGGDEDGLEENERDVEEAKDAAVTTATAGLEGDDASHSSHFPRGGRNGGEDAGDGGRAASRGVGEQTTTTLPPPPKLPTSQMQSRWGRRGGQRSTVVEAAIAAAAAAAAAAVGTTTTGTAEAVGSTSVPASTAKRAKRAEIAAPEGGPLAWSPINGAEAAATSRQARLDARRGERAAATTATAAATIGSKSDPTRGGEEGPRSTDGAASPPGVAILVDDEDEDNDNDNDNDNDIDGADESDGEEQGGQDQQEERNAVAGSSKAEAVVVGDKDSDVDGNSSSGGGGSGKGGAGRVRKPRGSEDAYMLIYVKRGVAWGPSSGERDRDKLPKDVLEAVQASNAVLTSEVARYRREKLQLEEDMRARRELYSALFGPPSKPPQRNRRKGTGKGKGPAKAIVIDGESGAGRQQDEEEEEEEEGEEEEEEDGEEEDEGEGGRQEEAGAGRKADQEQAGEGKERGQQQQQQAEQQREEEQPAPKKARRQPRRDSCTMAPDVSEALNSNTGGASQANGKQRPYVHPGPSDDQLSASAEAAATAAAAAAWAKAGGSGGAGAAYDEPSPAAVSAVAAAAAEADASTTQEELDYAQAVAASLAVVDSDTGPPLAESADAADDKEGERRRQGQGTTGDVQGRMREMPPDSEFFWVSSDWVRQWVVGQYAKVTSREDSSVAVAAVAAAAAESASEVGAGVVAKVKSEGSSPSAVVTSGGGEGASANPVVLDDSPAPKRGRVAADAGERAKHGMEVEVEVEVERTATGKGPAAGMGRAEGKAVVGGSGGGGSGGADCRGDSKTGDAGAPELAAETIEKTEEPQLGKEKDGRIDQREEQHPSVGTPDVATTGERNGVDSQGADNDKPGDGDTGTAELVAALSKGAGSERITAVTPPKGVFAQPVRNVPLLCPHGRLHPASVSRFKLVTRAVYEGMVGMKGVPPPDHHIAAGNYFCALCVKDHIDQKESNVNVSRESGELLKELEKPEPSWPLPRPTQGTSTRGQARGDSARSPGSAGGIPFAISRKWTADLKACHDQFLRAAARDPSNLAGGGGGKGRGKGAGQGGSSGRGSASPVVEDGSMRLPDGRVNHNITCEHGTLVGGKAGKRKYRWISAEGWEMVKKLFPLAAEMEYPAGTAPCSRCDEQDKGEMKLKLDLKQAKSAELLKCPALKGLWKRGGGFPPKLLAPHRELPSGSGSSSRSRGQGNAATANMPDRFFLAEAWWVSSWRCHHDSSSIHSDPPSLLLNEGLRCDHGLVIVGQRLRQVVETRQLPPGVGSSASASTSAAAALSVEDGAVEAEVLTEAEWLDLAKAGYVLENPPGGVTGAGASDSAEKDGAAGSPSVDASASSSPSRSAEEGSERTFGVSFSERQGGWVPGVCEECTKAAADRADRAKSIFKGKQVKVVKLKEGQEAPIEDEGGAQFSSTGRLKRNTRGRGAAPFEITCNSDDTVDHFKLQIFAAIEVAPVRQTLYLRGTQLVGGRTLRAANVKAGDTLHLKVAKASGDTQNDDQIFLDGLTKPSSGPEMGFQGTALMGGLSIGATSSNHNSEKPPPASGGGGGGGGTAMVDVEAAFAAAAMEEAYVNCPRCTAINDLTNARCVACESLLLA